MAIHQDDRDANVLAANIPHTAVLAFRFYRKNNFDYNQLHCWTRADCTESEMEQRMFFEGWASETMYFHGSVV